jgi:hypothetical protein
VQSTREEHQRLQGLSGDPGAGALTWEQAGLTGKRVGPRCHVPMAEVFLSILD